MGVTSAQRSPALPDMPTIAEAALPGYDTGSWIGLLAPAGTPAAVIDKITTDVREILGQSDTRQTFISQGAIPRSLSTAEFTALIDNDKKRYARIIQDKNIQSQ